MEVEREVERRTTSCPRESHPITQDESRDEHAAGGTERKVREEERAKERVKAAVGKRLVSALAHAATCLLVAQF